MQSNNNSIFINKINDSSATQAEEKQESTSQVTQYQGREVALVDHSSSIQIPQFVNPSFQFMTAMMHACSNLFEIEPQNIQASLPPSMTKALEKVGMMLQNLLELQQRPEPTENSNAHSFFNFLMSEAEIAKAKQQVEQQLITKQIAQEEQNEENQLIVQTQVTSIFQQLSDQKTKQLQLAGVSSWQELMQKQKTIASYRQTAEKEYLQDPRHVEIRQQIDGYMIQSYKGKLSKQDKAIIDQFWSYVSTAKDGHDKLAYIEKRTQDLFLNSVGESINDMMNQMMGAAMEAQMKGLNFQKEAFISSYFKEFMTKTASYVMKEREKTQDHQEQLMLDYLLLKGQCQMSFIMNTMQRQMLAQQVLEAENTIEHFVEIHQKSNQETIATLTEKIKKVQNQLQNLSSANNTSQKESAELTVTSLEKSLKKYQESLEIELARKAKGFKTDAKITAKRFGVDLDALKAAIPAETAFDHVMSKIASIESPEIAKGSTQSVSLLLAVSADSKLNLNELKDPVQHFMHQIIEKDLKKLEVLKPRIEEIND